MDAKFLSPGPCPQPPTPPVTPLAIAFVACVRLRKKRNLLRIRCFSKPFIDCDPRGSGLPFAGVFVVDADGRRKPGIVDVELALRSAALAAALAPRLEQLPKLLVLVLSRSVDEWWLEYAKLVWWSWW